MAALTNEDYGQMRRSVYRTGQGKEELKALAGLPSESELRAAFQVIENFWTNNAAQVKSDVEAALGRSITNALARKIHLAWLIWKISKGG
jgi:hypothetical protein